MNRVFFTLIRREFWENKALWIAPLAAAGLILAGSAFGQMWVDGVRTPPSARMAMGMMVGVIGFLGVIACLAVFSYLTDCLYSERKDRSILFWKSLPVSDLQTVLSKLVVAMVVVPLGVLLLSLVTQLIGAGIISLRADAVAVWPGAGAWFETLGRVLVAWCFAVLWYAPVAVYLMLASVLARRAPVAYAVLPFVVLTLWEKLMFDTNHIGQFLAGRLMPWSRNGIHVLGPNGDLLQAFTDPQLWLGLAVAAGMLYIVVRLRRYRDDT